MTGDSRTRVLEATVATFGRVGIAKATVEEVAVESGVSRATIYRWFPGGREQLVAEAIAHEVGRFFDGLAAEVSGTMDLAAWLECFIVYARRTLAGHEVFQKVVETEPERLLPHLSAAAPIALAWVRSSLEPVLDRTQLRQGVSADEASEWLSRMMLSFLAADGCWELSDAASVHELVAQLTAGVLPFRPRRSRKGKQAGVT